MRQFALTSFALAFALAACSQPADSADPQGAEAADVAPTAAPAPAVAETPVEAGFSGAWAADPAWCANTTGAEQPIRISESRFEGYENGCDIVTIDGAAGSWNATLACQAEGQLSSEQVRMEVVGETLNLTYLDRGAETVALTRCRP